MPLFEYSGMVRGKLDTDQKRPMTCPINLSPIPENDFAELVWDNGQIKIRGQPNGVRKSQVSDLAMHMPRSQDRYIGNATSSRIGKVGLVKSRLDDASQAVPSVETDFAQDDDSVPWLNNPIGELLPDVSGVTTNEPSNRNSVPSMNKRINLFPPSGNRNSTAMRNDQKLEDSNGAGISSSKTGLKSPWSYQQGQTSVSSAGAGVSNILSCNTTANRSSAFGDSVPDQPLASAHPGMKVQKQDITLTSSSSSLLNFPFLARHATLARAGLQNAARVNTSGSSAAEKIGYKERSCDACDSPGNDLPKEHNIHIQQPLVVSKVDSIPSGLQLREQSCSVRQSNDIHQVDSEETEASTCQVISVNPNKGVLGGKKNVEPIVGSSSVCSDSSGDRTSNDQAHILKRKGRDNEEPEYQSEDGEEESVGVKTAVLARGGTGSKRRRAAEIHNLSERGRRDRINEKMRALQELIPNCNKADKASMLDEAIDYLKTLQLQVQIMSTGAALCIPPMMFPAGMQHLHATRMPHFPPMGVGMGMGMGMGMLNMNGGSPVFPVPPTQHTHFPSPSIYGPANLARLAGHNVPILGHPGQGPVVSVPRAPLLHPSDKAPTSSSVSVSAERMRYHVKVQTCDQAPQVSRSADGNLINGNDVVSGGEAGSN